MKATIRIKIKKKNGKTPCNFISKPPSTKLNISTSTNLNSVWVPVELELKQWKQWMNLFHQEHQSWEHPPESWMRGSMMYTATHIQLQSSRQKLYTTPLEMLDSIWGCNVCKSILSDTKLDHYWVAICNSAGVLPVIISSLFKFQLGMKGFL